MTRLRIGLLVALGLGLAVAMAQDWPRGDGSVGEIALWEKGAPGTAGMRDAEEHRGDLVLNTYQPSIRVYLPDRRVATGTGVVICPGGGYKDLEMGREGAAVARRLGADGIAGFVLKYRLRRPDNPAYDPAPDAMQDGLRAVRYVRAHAHDWGLRPDRIGIMGFSAGGDVASRVGTRFDGAIRDPSDPIDRVSSRPDFLVLIYGMVGPQAASVTAKTPPAFLAHATDDTVVDAQESIRFHEALVKAGVPSELRLFPTGGHGFDLGDPGTPAAKWPEMLTDWMRRRGLLTGGHRNSGHSAQTPDSQHVHGARRSILQPVSSLRV